MVAKLRAWEAANEDREVGREMLQSGDIQVILVFMGQKQIIDILGEGLECYSGIRKDMSVKPRALISALREPRVGQDFKVPRVSERASLTVIGNPHISRSFPLLLSGGR
jgi:hypothetical protein